MAGRARETPFHLWEEPVGLQHLGTLEENKVMRDGPAAGHRPQVVW